MTANKEERPVRSGGIARRSQHARLTGGVSLPHVSTQPNTRPRRRRCGWERCLPLALRR